LTRILILLTLLAHLGTPTLADVDSLEVELQTATGTERIDVLNELYKEYRNSEPLEALNYTLEARDLSKSINYQKGLGRALNNLGVYYKNLGDYDNSLQHFLQSLAIQEELIDTERIGFTLSNIGILYSIKREYDKALNSFQSALKIFEEMGNIEFQVGAMNNIGNVHYEKGEVDRALEIYLEAMALLEENDQLQNAFDVLNNIGNIHNSRLEYDKAMDNYFRSLEIERVNKNKFGQAHSLFNIGETYRNQSKFDLATTYLGQSAELARELNDNPLLARIYSSISEVYFATDQTVLAFLTLKRQNVIRDSLFNEESSRKLAQLEALYELDKIEKENILLQKENENKSLQNRNAQLIIFAFVFVSLSILAVAGLIYLRYRQNQQANQILEKRNLEISMQKQIIETKNQDITDSIYYAKSIQDAILNKNLVLKNLPNSFIFYKPKDIVSGDFYWYHHEQDFDILAVLDCTGHGVAGAFMTIMANTILNQIINESRITRPRDILAELDKKILEALKQQEIKQSSHGMDVALCRIDNQTKKLTFAGAKRPLYHLRSNELVEIKGSKSGIADSLDRESKRFEELEIEHGPGDAFYIASDGFADQFGGEQNKKYMTKNFKEFLQKSYQDPIPGQAARLEAEIKEWAGEHEQTDDILVIGFSP